MRKKYLDNAKGIAIIFVIIGHIFYPATIFKRWFYSFHLPIFFIISGMLLYKNCTQEKELNLKMSKKIKSLGIPYLTFSFLSTIAIALLSIIKGESKNIIIDGIKNNVKAILLLRGVKATWFLPCLFLSIFLFYIIYNTCKNKKLVPIIITILFFIPFLKIDFVSISCKLILYRAFIACAWIAIGFYSYKTIESLNINVLYLLLGFILSLLYIRLNKNLFDLCSLSLYDPLLYILSGLLGSFCFILLFKKIEDSNIKINLNILNYLGKNSLIIFGTHMVIIYYIKYFIIKIFGEQYVNTQIFSVSIILMLVLLIEIPIIMLFNKVFPCLIGKKKKNDKYTSYEVV